MIEANNLSMNSGQGKKSVLMAAIEQLMKVLPIFMFIQQLQIR
jgi:hypothetical protein